MRQLTFITIACLTFIITSISFAKAQDNKIDFAVTWKDSSDRNIIVVTIIKGNDPVSCYIYDNPPFDEGKLIKKVECISDRNFDIEISQKMKVFVCVFYSKNHNQFAYKWLDVVK
jgi:hypothetical protein